MGVSMEWSGGSAEWPHDSWANCVPGSVFILAAAGYVALAGQVRSNKPLELARTIVRYENFWLPMPRTWKELATFQDDGRDFEACLRDCLRDCSDCCGNFETAEKEAKVLREARDIATMWPRNHLARSLPYLLKTGVAMHSHEPLTSGEVALAVLAAGDIFCRFETLEDADIADDEIDYRLIGILDQMRELSERNLGCRFLST